MAKKVQHRLEVELLVDRVLKSDLLSTKEKPFVTEDDLFGNEGVFTQMMKGCMERLLDAELDDHLGYKKHDLKGKGTGNSRNGTGEKTVKTRSGNLTLKTPRDRNGTFDPKLIKKRQRRIQKIEQDIMSLYCRGMSVNDIKRTLAEMYDVEVSSGFISTMTHAIEDDIKAFQERRLEAVYPVVYMDGTFIKVNRRGKVIDCVVYLVIGISLSGNREVLGIYLQESEGARFWRTVLDDLRRRGLKSIFICCIDGLKGFPEAIESIYPEAEIQVCSVHLVRNCMVGVPWKERKAVCEDIRHIYKASTLEEAKIALSALEEKWGKRYPHIPKIWHHHWEYITAQFSYPEEIRKSIYTTNLIENINSMVKKVIKNKRSFPNERAAMKIVFASLREVEKTIGSKAQSYWLKAMEFFKVRFKDKLTEVLEALTTEGETESRGYVLLEKLLNST